MFFSCSSKYHRFIFSNALEEYRMPVSGLNENINRFQTPTARRYNPVFSNAIEKLFCSLSKLGNCMKLASGSSANYGPIRINLIVG